MYALYERRQDGDFWRYVYRSKVSLFGCRTGRIPLLMLKTAPSGQSEPYRWHLDVPAGLASTGTPNTTLIIDLKPSQHDTNLSLYELLDVWGWSDCGWTPIMMRLRGLFVDADPEQVNTEDFHYNLENADDPIFSVMYLGGSIKDGHLTGRWTPPGPSSTNGVLMWPETLQYFFGEAQRIINGGSA